MQKKKGLRGILFPFSGLRHVLPGKTGLTTLSIGLRKLTTTKPVLNFILYALLLVTAQHCQVFLGRVK